MLALVEGRWDIIIVGLVAAVPATLGAWSARRAQKHTRSRNGGKGVNDDLLHLSEDFSDFKNEVRGQWKFHIDFHHSDRDIAAQSEERRR